VDRHALLRTLIYRALRRITALSELVQARKENPSILESVGIPALQSVPSLERFSEWLRPTDNESLPHISILKSTCESFHVRQHQYLYGFERNEAAPEVHIQWVRMSRSRRHPA
jgi:hypothetical protein